MEESYFVMPYLGRRYLSVVWRCPLLNESSTLENKYAEYQGVKQQWCGARDWLGGTTYLGAPWIIVTVACYTTHQGFAKLVHSSENALQLNDDHASTHTLKQKSCHSGIRPISVLAKQVKIFETMPFKSFENAPLVHNSP